MGVCGDVPFECDAQISRAQLTWFPQLKLSEEVKSLITGCLMVNTQERLTLSQVTTHPWLMGKTIPGTVARARNTELLFPPNERNQASYSSSASSTSSSSAMSSSSCSSSLCSV